MGTAESSSLRVCSVDSKGRQPSCKCRGLFFLDSSLLPQIANCFYTVLIWKVRDCLDKTLSPLSNYAGERRNNKRQTPHYYHRVRTHAHLQEVETPNKKTVFPLLMPVKLCFQLNMNDFFELSIEFNLIEYIFIEWSLSIRIKQFLWLQISAS